MSIVGKYHHQHLSYVLKCVSIQFFFSQQIRPIKLKQYQNITASIINRYQSGELDWSSYPAFGNATPSGLSVQEPLDNETVALSLIDRLVLVTPPSSCREQSPCPNSNQFFNCL